jgi:hypothetical protein
MSRPLLERCQGGQNLYTPHRQEDYPGIFLYRNGPAWILGILCPQPGQGFVALGGERLLAYETPTGARAQGFELRCGDRATLVRVDGPHHLAEWVIERAPG